MSAPRTCECMACPKCNVREWARNRYRLQAYGQWDPHADLDAVRAHLDDLRAHGIGVTAIAKASGVGRSQVERIRRGATKRIGKETAAKLLAVTPEDRAQLPAWRVTRRLRALNAIGYSTRHLADLLGTTQEVVSDHLVGDRKWVQVKTLDSVSELYERLCMTPGGNAASRRIAGKRGYAPPLAWENIDDPDEQPTGIGHISPERGAALRDMHALGFNTTEAARRLDVREKTLERWCERNGMQDVWRQMAQRQENVA